MIRIQFSTDQDRVKGNYLLATKSVVRCLRGQISEIAERDLKLLDEHQIHYTILPIPEPSETDQTIQNPLTLNYRGNGLIDRVTRQWGRDLFRSRSGAWNGKSQYIKGRSQMRRRNRTPMKDSFVTGKRS